jgi:energy-converting hydrogenase Eha subunit A
MRWLYAVATVIMLIGAVVCLVLDYLEISHIVRDYIVFAAWSVAVSFPIVVLKTGWIGLAIQRFGRRNQSSPAASPDQLPKN